MITENEAKERFYLLFNEELRDIVEDAACKGEKSVVIDFFDIDRIDSVLGDYILDNAKDAFIVASEALREVETACESTLKYVRIKSIPEAYKKKLSKIKSTDVGKLIEFEGVVKRITEVYPKMKKVAWKCAKCGYEFKMDTFSVFHIPNEKAKMPMVCPNCGRKTVFEMIPEKSERVDYQKMEVQEFFEEMSLSGTKHKMIVHVFDDMVNVASAGDRVRVVGILYDRPLWRKGNAVSTTNVIECVALWIEPLEKSFEEINITEEDIKKIKEVSKQPDLFEKFVDCIAPSIYGLREIKKGILLQLFGGIAKTPPDGTRRRGDIHILLAGDPATAKSQLTYYATKLSPKGIFIGSKTASASGLIASVVRDTEFGDGRWILDAGAMALADMGLVGLDELDKMRKEDRDALHTAMEQQEVGISKAGITATLKTRCSVIANANPKLGRFEDYSNDAEQIDLPPTLLSRFDLIFILKDKPNKAVDEALAEHVLNIHSNKNIRTPFDINFIRKYIAYAKKYVFPELTEEASKKIKEYYVKTRTSSNEKLPLTPRYLETLIRLSEASARVRLSQKIEIVDVENAIDILEYSLWSSALDKETNMIDTDIISSGIPRTKRDKLKLILKIIEDETKINGGIYKQDLIEKCREYDMDAYEVDSLLGILMRESKIMELKPNYITLVPL